MSDLRFLLDHPDLVLPGAPWCSWLDNLELGILLLAQPWLAGDGLRRAELEQQLARAGADLPLGPIYFQRVNRCVAALVERGQLRSHGSGRRRRFTTTARGFAALVINLHELRADPTLDGSEFELKRALVALWNLVVTRVSAAPEPAPPSSDESLLDRLAALAVLGRPVITDQVLASAFNLLRLVDHQRERVGGMMATCERRLQSARIHGRLLAAAGTPGTDPHAAAVRVVAISDGPRLASEAALARYRAYLAYLDDLAALYARELRLVDLRAVRQVLGGSA